MLPGNIKPLKQVGVGGYIYRNIYTNIILFIPFALFCLYKEKKGSYNVLVFILLILFMVLLYIGCKLEYVSTYYFYKTYVILWFLIIYLFARGIFLISRNFTNKNCEPKIHFRNVLKVSLMELDIF